jgi:hypothetical protein
VANLKEHWRNSLHFRRIITASAFALAALLVYLGSHIPRPLSLPADDLNAKSVARVNEEQIILEKPDIGEGDLALSYVGNKNEIADIWVDNATLDDNSRQLLFPGTVLAGPSAISYTTGPVPVHGKPQSDDTCHTTIAIRRAQGSPPIDRLKLYQTDTTAGAQRYRQVVLDAGKTPMEIEVHTDSPIPGELGVSNLPGCHKILGVSGSKPVDLPQLPIRLLVSSGKIDLHFSPANPALPIWTGREQTFEAVSLGDGTLRGNGLQITTIQPAKDAPLDVRADGNEISFSRLKLGSEKLRLDIGRDSEKATVFADGVSPYNYDLIDTMQKNLVVSSVFAVFLAPILWKWVRKNCFPDMPEIKEE